MTHQGGPATKKSRWTGFLARGAISIALLAWAFQSVDFASLRDAMTPRLALATLIGALVVSACAAPQAERWRLIATAARTRISWPTALRATLLSYFMVAVTPATVGADGVRILAMRRAGAAWAEGIAIILADRMYGMVAILILGLLGLPFIWTHAPELVLPVAAPIAFLALGVAAGVICLRIRMPREWLRIGAARTLARLSRAARLATLGHRLVSTSLALSLLIMIANAAAFWLIAAAAAVPADPALVLSVYPGMLLLGFVPVSVNGWGLREVSLVAMMAPFGVPSGAALAASIAYGSAVFGSSLLGIALWWLLREPEATTPREEPA